MDVVEKRGGAYMCKNNLISPKASIIVPVYNVENSISRCLKSLQTQTLSNIEIILIDDGSIDKSGAICEQFAVNDSRIVVIHQTNSGVSEARNKGIELAKSKYILFVDSDDYVDSSFVESMLKNESDLTLCGMQKENENGRTISEVKYSNIFYAKKKDIDYVVFISQRGIYSPYCKLFRRSIIIDNKIRFPKNVSWGEDGMFLGDYLQYVKSMRFINYNGYHYVRYSGCDSLSTKVRKDIMDLIVVSRLYLRDSLINVATAGQEQIEEEIDFNICLNCASFLEILLTSAAISDNEKIELLCLFAKNQYVKKVLNEPERFISKRMQKCFKMTKPQKMVKTYKNMLIRQEQKRIWKKRLLRRLRLIKE